MRSELNETVLIDRYLFRQLDKEETRTFEANLLVNESLHEKVTAQRLAHRIVRRHAQAEERGRFETIYRLLMTDTAFADQLKTIFA
jgi:hypothetical protein